MWSVKFEVWSAKSAVWSVECEDFASSLAEKIKRLSREGHGRDRVSLNYSHLCLGNFRRRLARVYVIILLEVVPGQHSEISHRLDML